MGKLFKLIGAIVVLALVVAGVRYFIQQRAAHRVGIISQAIEHHGNNWQADFVARLAAPQAQVYESLKNIEKARSDEIRNVKVISEHGNRKEVEIKVAGPTGPITTRLEFEYFPAEHRITYRTLDSTQFVTHAEYTLSDEGPTTLMKFHESTEVPEKLPLPDPVVKQVIRGMFISELQGLNKSLNLSIADNGSVDQDRNPDSSDRQ